MRSPRSWKPAFDLYHVDGRLLWTVAVVLMALWSCGVVASLWRTHAGREALSVRLAQQVARVHYEADRALHLGGQPFGHENLHGPVHVDWKGLPGTRGRGAPDAWEARALARSGRDGEAISERVVRFGEEQLRWITPVREEPACLACHPAAENPGGLRGGASILVPMRTVLAFSESSRKRQVQAHFGAWLLGCAVFGFMAILIERALRERDRVAVELREALSANETILEGVPFGMAIVDRKKVVRYLNRYAEKLMGRPREEVVGRVCSGNFCPTSSSSCPILDLNQEMDSAERMVLAADGTSIPVQKSVIPLSWQGEEVLFEAFIDISEQKTLLAEQEAALREEQRLNRLSVGRELRMVQIKQEVNRLLAEAGAEPRYVIPDETVAHGAPPPTANDEVRT